MVLSTLVGDSVVRSPMLPIQEHMLLVVKAVEELSLFIAATQDRDWEEAAVRQQEIASIEAEADRVKLQFRRHLPKRLLMPIARTDLLDLISAQDKLANRTKDIAGLMLGRQMAFPGKLDKQLNIFVDLSVQSTVGALNAVKSTNDLFRSGFGSHQAKEVEQKIADVERLERRSDKQQTKLRARLYKLEKDLSPVDVMFLYQVLVWLGNIADRAEKITHRLLLISKS